MAGLDDFSPAQREKLERRAEQALLRIWQRRHPGCPVRLEPVETTDGASQPERDKVEEMNASLKGNETQQPQSASVGSPVVSDDQPETSEFLTVAEVADLLKLNQQTVRNWIDRGELPALRAGARRVRIRREDLEALIASQLPHTRTPRPRTRTRRSPFEDPEVIAAVRTIGEAVVDLAQALERARESPKP